jgi:hypothetical protein
MISELLISAAKVLRDSPLPMLRALDVSETDDEVVLRGRVNSYYQKQLAQEAILPVLGPRRLQNLVVVVRK